MTPQELKNSILQLAIQGKLVEHIDSEEKINVESSFDGNNDELFEIPDNWKWMAIKDVANVSTGLSFKKQDQKDSEHGDLRILRGGNIGDDYKYHLYGDDIYVSFGEFKDKYIQLLQGDVITPSVTSMEKMCKTGYIDKKLDKTTAGGFVYIIRCNNDKVIDSKYLLYYISSAFNKEQCKPNIHKSGQAFYNLKKSGFVEQPICIPPLAEQHRIVSKIEELFPLVDRYEKAYTRLEEFNKKFPGNMQKSILQMAIQGKLVEQREEEGTGEELFEKIQEEKKRLIKEGKIKKEKALPEISDDEKPFDIPESWKWCYVGDLFTHNTGKAMNSSAKTIEKSGAIRKFITTSNLYWNTFDFTLVKEMFFSDDELYRCTVTKGDLLMCEGGAYYGRTAIWNYDYDICFQNHIHRLRPYMQLNLLYFYHIFYFYKNSGMMNAKGTAMPGLSSDTLHKMKVPLPPLAEQKRIVAKLEELLPLCDELKR